MYGGGDHRNSNIGRMFRRMGNYVPEVIEVDSTRVDVGEYMDRGYYSMWVGSRCRELYIGYGELVLPEDRSRRYMYHIYRKVT